MSTRRADEEEDFDEEDFEMDDEDLELPTDS